VPTISVNELQVLAEDFLNKVFNKIKLKEFVVEPHWDIDHLCFRVETADEYEAYRDTFSGLGDLLTEMNLNGRPIATFELHTPIQYKTWLIKLIELPAPKKGKAVKTGFEHLEMVVDISLED
jgi:predicted metalloenzyme YecM